MTGLILRGLATALMAGVAAAALPAGAGATPIGAAAKNAKNVSAPSEVVKVHARKDRHHHRRYYERHDYERDVDAPFTHVETGRHTFVDAPFAMVYVGRHGRYVRAPFVNLWIPR